MSLTPALEAKIAASTEVLRDIAAKYSPAAFANRAKWSGRMVRYLPWR